MIILHGVALLLSTAVTNKTGVVLRCQDRGTRYETCTRGPMCPRHPRCAGTGRAGTREQRDGGTGRGCAHRHQQHPRHSRNQSRECICLNLRFCDRQNPRHFSIAAPAWPPESSSAAQAHPDARELCSHQPYRKHGKNITLMRKSPSAGSTFLMRFPTPGGKQPAGAFARLLWQAAPSLCSSRDVLYAAATARREAEEPPALSPDAAPSHIAYVFSCVFKAHPISPLMRCLVTAQFLLGRSGEPAEAG